MSKTTLDITPPPWVARFHAASKVAKLRPAQHQELFHFLKTHVFTADTPAPIQQVFAGALLEDAIWDAKNRGLEEASAKLMLILELMRLVAVGKRLEEVRLIDVAPRVALEFALGRLIPDAPQDWLTSSKVNLWQAIGAETPTSALIA